MGAVGADGCGATDVNPRGRKGDPKPPSISFFICLNLLPGQTHLTTLIKPDGINGRSRSLSGTPTPLLSPAKSTIRTPPGALSEKKTSKVIYLPDSPAIICAAEGTTLFRAADKELGTRGSGVEMSLWSLGFLSYLPSRSPCRSSSNGP